jgi:AraC family transcriptional regulator
MLIAHTPAALDASSGDVLLWHRGRSASAGTADGRLCVKTMVQGAEEITRRGARMRLDEDAYLILNSGEPSACVYRAEGEARALSLHYADATLAQAALHGADADEPSRCAPRFLEHLRPRGDCVGQRLALIVRRLEADDRGERDQTWYECQALALLDDAIAMEDELRVAAQRIASVKPATQHELHRRVAIAADYIWSNHERPTTLADIAGAAHLSRFHLVRLFRQVYGQTPHAYLQEKRLMVAERLLARTDLDLEEVAARAGFGNRWSLFRQLRRRRGRSGDAMRRTFEGSPACPTSA